jgi:RNase H-fold protein (predicted Holliday junction resolvase)
MKYLIEKITLIRVNGDGKPKKFNYDTKEETSDLKKFREEIKRKFNVTKVHLNYQEIAESGSTETSKEIYKQELNDSED